MCAKSHAAINKKELLEMFMIVSSDQIKTVESDGHCVRY